MQYEYSVIPAPARGEKAKGAKTPIERFSVTLAAALNDMAAEGWEYVRAEALPSEERSGLAGRTTVFHNILIFRRPVEAPIETPVAQPVVQAIPQPIPQPVTPAPAANTAIPVDEPPVAAPDPAPRAMAPVFSQPMRMAQDPKPAPGPRLGPASK